MENELMPAVILAGGLATRLGPLTENIPKAMIEVAGQPFLWHQLTLLRRSGIRRVIMLVAHLGHAISQRFGDGTALGISIQYSFDGPTLLGTAGAIRSATNARIGASLNARVHARPVGAGRCRRTSSH